MIGSYGVYNAVDSRYNVIMTPQDVYFPGATITGASCGLVSQSNENLQSNAFFETSFFKQFWILIFLNKTILKQ